MWRLVRRPMSPPARRLRALGRRIAGEPGAAETGSAVVEFVVLGTLLLVPVVYFILTLGTVQAGSFAVVGAADQAAKTIALSEDAAGAGGAAREAAASTMSDFGFDAAAYQLDISCSDGGCTDPGARVTVAVRLDVPLPFAPVIGGSSPSATTVSSSATEIIGRYR